MFPSLVELSWAGGGTCSASRCHCAPASDWTPRAPRFGPRLGAGGRSLLGAVREGVSFYRLGAPLVWAGGRHSCCGLRGKLLGRCSAGSRGLFPRRVLWCSCTIDRLRQPSSFRSSDCGLWSYGVSIVVGDSVVEFDLWWIEDVYGLKFVPWSMVFHLGRLYRLETRLTNHHKLLVGAESFTWE